MCLLQKQYAWKRLGGINLCSFPKIKKFLRRTKKNILYCNIFVKFVWWVRKCEIKKIAYNVSNKSQNFIWAFFHESRAHILWAFTKTNSINFFHDSSIIAHNIDFFQNGMSLHSHSMEIFSRIRNDSSKCIFFIKCVFNGTKKYYFDIIQ